MSSDLVPTPVRILVIDDDERVIRLVAAQVERRGWHCTGANDGPRGFAMAADGGFEVVLVDLGLPGMDGLSVVREIHRVSPATSIVVLTGAATADNAIRSMRHGALDFVAKPFHLKTLDEALDRAIAARGSHAPGSASAQASDGSARGADSLPALHRSVDTFVALLETGNGERASTSSTSSSGDDNGSAAVQLVARALQLPRDDMRRLRWAQRLASLPAETLAGLEAVGDAARAARLRRERWDGTGPQRLAGDGIPVVARCLAVVEAVAGAAPAGAGVSAEAAHAVLVAGNGRVFDPAIVTACLAASEVERRELVAAGPTPGPYRGPARRPELPPNAI